MLELMNYEGCGKCEKCENSFDCKSHSEPVTITFNKAQKWDNSGEWLLLSETEML